MVGADCATVGDVIYMGVKVVGDLKIETLTEAQAIKLMIQRIRSLPWTNNETGTMVSVSSIAWKQWMREIDQIDGEPSPL